MKPFLLFFLLSFVSYTEAQTPRSVLWLGTSIPAGCTYPYVACENMQMNCINKSVGASFLTMWTEERGFSVVNSGLSLTMSREEKERAFRSYVNSGVITENILNFWKDTSYESLILPYIKDVDIVVIDHGYNDDYSLEKIYNAGKESVNWNSQDRNDFIGAFNFIYTLIKKEQPHALVVIGGYFQHSCTIGYFKRGIWVSTVLSWIAEHYGIPLLDTWNYTDIPDGYIPNSSTFLSELNEAYGTFFECVYPDSEGNITYFQRFCPDGVHPFSDPTGESDRILNSITSDLLGTILTKYCAINPPPH